MAWALLLNNTNVTGSRYCTAVCTSMPCMKNAPSPAITTVRPLGPLYRTAEGHPDTGTEAVAHAPHAERDREPTATPDRQIVDGGRAGVAGVDDDVDTVGQHAVQHRHGVAVAHTGTGEGWWAEFGVSHEIGHAHAPWPPPSGQRPGQHSQRRPQVVGMHVSAREVRRRRTDRDGAHCRQCVVEAGAGGHRQPGTDHQAQRRRS